MPTSKESYNRQKRKLDDSISTTEQILAELWNHRTLLNVKYQKVFLEKHGQPTGIAEEKPMTTTSIDESQDDNPTIINDEDAKKDRHQEENQSGSSTTTAMQLFSTITNLEPEFKNDSNSIPFNIASKSVDTGPTGFDINNFDNQLNFDLNRIKREFDEEFDDQNDDEDKDEDEDEDEDENEDEDEEEFEEVKF